MERRTFLASAGTGLTTATVGCLSQETRGDSSEANAEATATTAEESLAETGRTAEKTHIEAGGSVERTVGTASLEDRGLRRAHHVAFGNPTEEPHRGTIAVSKNDEAVFEESVELEANASIVVSLTDLDTYTVRVVAPELDATEAISIDPGHFTCNVTRTTVSVREDGTLDSMGISTRMACPGVVTETAAADESASHTLGTDPIPADTGKGSHTLVLRNPSEETWTTRLIVENDSTAQFDGVYTVEPEATVLVTLSESGTYTVSMDVLETGTTITEQVTPGNFDCNQSSTRAEIDASGELTASTVSTLMACDVETNSTNEST
ncbi:hypothetical protein [Natronobacterium gregoryi]|uniref:Uncharacterized protein n=2 Tax=Natronobacterium gregoryi TaxID=44930 RepID=L0ADK4_NATGS|nr:hypothetical protein [Natronobacterium gregoryi]AFZ71993.1 hypothetical protein Natgr_0751 [Natronobacterium gregoryi SP2]ELY62644.1 hypothetical protein C490_17504 [Natronobacterium gregoryi SP2]PLK20847.1 hypothetical protein CYV19_07135 [Natronobacterium gregoryi SP2]SFJ19649.1 hypothetical protein SAMN05443661_11731 [Natronobacterium gregoryi]